MLRISNALKGVILLIVSAQAVNTSNLQVDGTLYKTQFAQDGPTTDLAQLEASAESEQGVAPCL